MISASRTNAETEMADDLLKRGPSDAQRVNVNEAHELSYWTAKWGVTADEVRAAVKKVGVMARDVQKELGK